MRLFKEGADGLGHDGAHVVDGQQLLFRRIHDRVEHSEMPRQVLGRGLAHVADAQGKQEARQRGLLGFFERRQHVLGRFLGHALQRDERGQAQSVQVGQCADHVGIHQLVHQLVAQALDVHGAACGKVQDGFLALRGAEQAAGAAVVGFALFAHHGAAADGAGLGHAEVGHIAGAVARHHPYHLGDHIARTAHDDGVAHPHALLADLEQVVQRGIGHGDPAHKHRRQACDRRDLAGAAHLHIDAYDLGGHLLRRVLVRHGPARFAGLEAQVTLQLQRVDLVNHTVDVVRQRIAAGTHALVERYQFSSTYRNLYLRCHRKPPEFQRLQHLVVRAEHRPTFGRRRNRAQAVGKKTQGPLGGDVGVELAHCACGGIARVHKRLAPLLPLALVQRIKVCTAHVDLATHLQQGRNALGQGQRDLPDGADVVRHVLAHLAITARSGLHQAALFIAQAHGQAVKLGLGHVFDGRVGIGQAQLAPHAGIKRLGACGLGVGFGVDAEHGHRVAHGGQALHHRANHALRGRIGGDKVRVRGFQRLQLAEHAVVFGVGHGGLVQHVVLVGPLVELVAQRFDFDSWLRLIHRRWGRKKVEILGHFSDRPRCAPYAAYTTGAVHAWDTEPGPPRSEGVVPLEGEDAEGGSGGASYL